MSTFGKKTSRREDGFVAVFVSFLLIVIIIMAALSVDVGVALMEQRRIQFAADAGVLAGTKLLVNAASHTDAEVDSEVQAVAIENQFDVSEAHTIDCGRWDDHDSNPLTLDTFAVCCNAGCPCDDCEDTPNTNAVRMTIQRDVPTAFAHVVGISMMMPSVEAIARTNEGLGQNCIRPFSFEQDTVYDPDDGSTFISPGDYITVGGNGPGNWGKIDLFGNNYSSGRNFRDDLISGVCGEEVEIGESVSAGTGFGGSIRHAFEGVVDAGADTNMIFAIVTPFGNGNSSPVDIVEFIKVNFLSQTGNGRNWNGVFEVVEFPCTNVPTTGGFSGNQVSELVQ